jgi:hypothetical protein
MKKGLIALGAIMLAPMLAMTLVVFAAGEWRQAGETAAGDRVLVSSVRTLRHAQRTALVRIEFKEPTKLPQGGPFVEMRARVQFNCATRRANPSTEWFYAHDRSGRLVVVRKTKHDDHFGQESEGGFGAMATNYVCEQ